MAGNPDHNRGLRPLLPVPQNALAASFGRTTLPRKRVQIKNACQSCRQRKTKCNGAKPRCFACAERQLVCKYEEDDKESRKRKLQDTEDHLNTHQQLFDIIRSGSEEEAWDIVLRIRRGQDAKAMLRQLQGGNLLVQLSLVPETWCRYSFPLSTEIPASIRGSHSPYLKSLIYEQAVERPQLEHAAGLSVASRTRCNMLAQYHIPYHAAKVVDPRLGSGSPTEWTCVPVSGELFHDLLQTYFLFEYPMFPFFHKDSFLDDMVQGRRGFCSSLLVNVILAAGCQAYPKVANRTEFWNPQTFQYQFSAEARRLWDIEVDTPSIMTVQAGLIMSLMCNFNGVDKVGWSYLVQTIAMATKLGIFDSPSGTPGKKNRAARAVTAWSLFIWQSIFCFHFYRPPLLRVPPQIPLPDPKDRLAWYPKFFILYPLQQVPISANYGDYLKAAAEFHVIVNSIGFLAFPNIEARARLSPEQARGFYNRLRKWFAELPDPLSIKNAILPWQLSLHMHYFNIVDWLVEPFKSSQQEYGEVESRVTFPVDDVGEAMAEEISLSAKTSLETVFRLYYMRHSFEVFDPLMLQFHSYVGFMALKQISTQLDRSPSLLKELQSTLALAAMGLRDQGKMSYMGSTIFRLLRDTAASQRALPVNEITAIGEDDEDEKSQIAQHVKSAFPINVVSITDDPEAQRVESLIADYKSLGLDDELGQSEVDSSPSH